jgi:hypothetical protein
VIPCRARAIAGSRALFADIDHPDDAEFVGQCRRRVEVSMAGEVSAAQIGEHITMPVAILSDDDDLVCDRVDYVPVFGLLLPDRTRTAWGLRLLGTKSSQTLCWREMDSNF